MVAPLRRIVLTAFAMAAGTAVLALPALAQTPPASPDAPPPPPPVHHTYHRAHGGHASDDALTAQLNRQELATVSGAAMPAATATNTTQINNAHEIEPAAAGPS